MIFFRPTDDPSPNVLGKVCMPIWLILKPLSLDLIASSAPIKGLFVVNLIFFKRDLLKNLEIYFEENETVILRSLILDQIHKEYEGNAHHLAIERFLDYENYFNDAIEKAIINEKKILSLPMFPDLTKKEITYVCDFIINFYNL